MGAAFLALIFVCETYAQVERRHDRVARLSPDAAKESWEEFASSKIAADYCMTFKLTHMPRKAKETVYNGTIYGSRSGDKVFTRIRISNPENNSPAHDFIMMSSPSDSKVWKAESGKFVEIEKKDWAKPICGGLIYSPIEIMMPYKFWNAQYEGPGRIGQAVHFFILTPPKGERVDGISKVRLALTREFNSPAQMEFFDENGNLSKTMALGSVRKIDGLWIMLEASVRQESTRDKDKLRFDAAKMRADLDKKIFDASMPAENPPIIDLKKL